MYLKKNINLFKQEIEKRNITELIHFTTFQNIYDIYKEKFIYSRKILDKIDKDEPYRYIFDVVIKPDKLRLDNLTDYISLSIQYPNKRLLNSKKLEYQDEEWLIIGIKPDCIFYEDTIFSIENAASNRSKSFGINGSIQTFKDMFCEKIQRVDNIIQLGLRENKQKNCPTNQQAEVLVKDKIGIEKISRLIVDDKSKIERLRSAINFFTNCKNKLKIDCDPSYFEI